MTKASPGIRSRSTPSPLPDGWRWARLGELIAEAQSGFACGERDPEGVVQLRMNNVDTRGSFVWDEVIRVPADPSTVDAYQLGSDDVLFNNTNSVELVGKSALFGGYKEPVVYSNHFTRLRTRRDLLLPDLLAAWLNLQWNQGIFANICNRWVGQSAVKPGKLLALGFPLPPLAEQKRIVAILNEQMTAVQRARETAEARLEAARALPGAYLREVFDSREARKWPTSRLGDVAIVGPDNGVFKRRHEFGAGVPIVNVSDLFRSLAVDLDATERVTVSGAELRRYAIAPGDVFFCRSSVKREGIGRCAYVREVQEPAVFDCHVMRVRLDREKALPEYVAYYWAHPSVREEVISGSRTATMTTINQSDLARMGLPLPTVAKQEEVVAALTRPMLAADQARTALGEQLEAIGAIARALLRRAFNGEL